MAPCSVLHHHKHCERVEERVYQGALPSSHLRYLNKAVGLQIYKKYNWQRVSDELAICTACEKGCQAGPSALQHVVSGIAKIILADFNLVVSTPITKLSNLNPHQIFQLYSI